MSGTVAIFELVFLPKNYSTILKAFPRFPGHRRTVVFNFYLYHNNSTALFSQLVFYNAIMLVKSQQPHSLCIIKSMKSEAIDFE